MEWLYTTFHWYFYLLILGLIFFPIVKRVFGSFLDFGYPFAKILATIFLSYLVFVLGVFKILPFERNSLFILLLVLTFINLLVLKRKSTEKLDLKTNIPYIILEEILFLGSLVFLVFIRGQEPSIHSLEKFMDFGFMNSLLRAKFFPPLDIWLSGDPSRPQGYAINYYYFGHLTGATLIKLTGIKPSIGYNLILATIFAQSITACLSLAINIARTTFKKLSILTLTFFGLLSSFLVNLAGNLHTIYVFTTGYPNDSPTPFWRILGGFHPEKYWYPNATRFIPYTIHEFPSYSYVVADLHGHVFDIPFVLLTLAFLFKIFNAKLPHSILNSKFLILNSIFLGFLAAIHYMTNAFDGPIYVLLALILFFFLFKNLSQTIFSLVLLAASFIIFSFPFTKNFEPFVTGIGVNCSPKFLVNIGKIGPFLFEKDKCQGSPLWMLFVLWGFFWITFVMFLLLKYLKNQLNEKWSQTDKFVFVVFAFGTFLLIIPEFFYVKDIYPLHFRANTMFKLGYQAYIMMSLASGYVILQLRMFRHRLRQAFKFVFIVLLTLLFIYPFFSFPSYYGTLTKIPQMDGSTWLDLSYPEDHEIIDFINKNIKGQPTILEAQGDSYTDYERISAYTGLPTVAGWWVHEWLWRDSSAVVGVRIPDIVNIYESSDLVLTKKLVQKYSIKYVVISRLERKKYLDLDAEKFTTLGKLIFTSSNGVGALYQLN